MINWKRLKMATAIVLAALTICGAFVGGLVVAVSLLRGLPLEVAIPLLMLAIVGLLIVGTYWAIEV